MDLKKLSLGAWFTAAAAVLTVIGLVTYSMNVNGAGYFKGAAVTNLVLFGIIAILFCAAAVVLATQKSNLVLEIVSSLLRIAAPVLVSYSFISLVAARVEGLAFIFFSNADVIKEVQTAANMSSATTAIVAMVALAIAAVAGMVAAFMGMQKEA